MTNIVRVILFRLSDRGTHVVCVTRPYNERREGADEGENQKEDEGA